MRVVDFVSTLYLFDGEAVSAAAGRLQGSRHEGVCECGCVLSTRPMESLCTGFMLWRCEASAGILQAAAQFSSSSLLTGLSQSVTASTRLQGYSLQPGVDALPIL